MQSKGFELVQLKDDHLNIIYKCICGNEATSNTKNIKKCNGCIKCQNHHRNYSNLCEKAKEKGFEILMTFKEYLKNHDITKIKHQICNTELYKKFSIDMQFTCSICQSLKKDNVIEINTIHQEIETNIDERVLKINKNQKKRKKKTRTN